MDPARPIWAVLVLGTVVTLACVLVAVRHRRNAAALWLTVVLLACLQWSLAYLLELAADDQAGRELWGAVKYAGVAVMPPAWLLFTLRYTGLLRRVRPWQVAALAVEPVVIWVVLALPETRDLVRYYEEPDDPAATSGVLFWVHIGYAYAMITTATVVLVVSLVRLSRVYRWTSVMLIASVVPPFAANAWFNLAGGPDSIDYTPFLFMLTAVVLIGGLFRSRVPHLRPLARSQVFETLPDAVLVLDPYDRLTDANPAGQRLLGMSTAAASGRPLADLAAPLAEPLAVHPRADEATATVRFRDRVYGLTLSPIGRQGQDVAGRLVMVRDVSDVHAEQERLAWQAMHDPLTRLANRRLLLEHLDTALARARRHRSEVALLYLDLDDFKGVNDTFGHAAGDALLAEVARRIDLTVRASDTAARLGGDEFAILLDGTATEAGARAAAEHVIGSVGEPVRLSQGHAQPGVSVGVAVGCPDRPEELLQAADEALYRAKRTGGGRLTVHRLSTGTPTSS